MSQKTEQDSRPIAEAVDLPEISVEHSTEFLTGSAPCAGVSRPLPAAWLGQRGIYRSRLEAVCNGEQLVDPLTLGELIQHAWRYLYLTRRAGLGLKPARQPLTSTTKTPEATDAAVDQMIAEEDADIRQDLTQQAEAERPELWAVHAQGPDELYAAFSREDAEKHAAELNALPMPEGIAVGAVVVPSPWPEAEHWKYLAEQEREHVDVARAALAQPSPAPTLRDAIDVANDRFEVPVAKWGTDLAGEEERPEVMEAYAEIGRAVEDSISRNIPDWSPSDCPSEVIVHLINERDAALARVAELRNALNNIVHASEYTTSATHQAEVERIAFAALNGAQPPTQAQHGVPGKYDDVLLPFLKSMEHELHANAKKGDRPSWMQMDRKTALLEIYYHLGKLQKATSDNDPAGIVEYAADVANMAMMLVDVCGLLAAAPDKEVGHE